MSFKVLHQLYFLNDTWLYWRTQCCEVKISELYGQMLGKGSDWEKSHKSRDEECERLTDKIRQGRATTLSEVDWKCLPSCIIKRTIN